jgi:hypothetical protein
VPGNLDEASAAAGNAFARAARWGVYAGLAIAAFVLTLGPIADGDIYWHLAAGRQMVQQYALPRIDQFTVSASGRPWIDVHWLFQLGAFALYAVSGFVGLAVAKAAWLAAGALLLTWLAERSAGLRAGLLCAVMVLGGLILDRHLVPLRPGLLTMGFLAVFLFALEELRRAPGRSQWPLVVLPLVQVIWCNVQGLAPLGLGLLAVYLGGVWLSSRGLRRWPFLPEDRAALRPLLIVLLTCSLASLVTPYGLQAVLLPLRLLARITPGQGNVFSSAIAENIPPFVLERTAPELVWHFKWVLGLLALMFAVARPRLHLAHLAVFFGFLGLALMANRNLPLFYWVAPPMVVLALASDPTPVFRWRWLRTPWPGRLLAAFLLCQGGLAAWLQAREPAVGRPTAFHFPSESARWLLEHQVQGPVFAADQHGGYLSFVAPELKPYIDTRLVLHTSEEYADYLALLEQPERFDGLAEREGFRAVVLPTTHPDRYLGLIGHLAHSTPWHLVFTDGYEVLFLREGPDFNLAEPATVDAILGSLAKRFGREGPLAESARLHLARLLVVLGHSGQAERVLASLSSRSAAQLRAWALFVSGDRAGAEALARVLVHQDSRDVRALSLLAECAASRGQGKQAMEWLSQALAIDPYDAQVRALIQRLGSGATSPRADEASSR